MQDRGAELTYRHGHLKCLHHRYNERQKSRTHVTAGEYSARLVPLLALRKTRMGLEDASAKLDDTAFSDDEFCFLIKYRKCVNSKTFR
jgi:hypothetical protein